MPRCLFVNWNDGSPPSQFSVSDDYTLTKTIGPEGTRLPARLTLLEVNAGAELYLDLAQIRSAYVIDIGPDQRITGDLGALRT